jgi:hypothetical protein
MSSVRLIEPSCPSFTPKSEAFLKPRPTSMPDPEYPTRLRELAERCRRAARNSFEVEAKGAFRTIGDELSNIADEIERSGGSGARHASG